MKPMPHLTLGHRPMVRELAERVRAKVTTAVDQLPSVGKANGDTIQLRTREFGPDQGLLKKLFTGRSEAAALKSLESLAPEPPG